MDMQFLDINLSEEEGATDIFNVSNSFSETDQLETAELSELFEKQAILELVKPEEATHIATKSGSWFDPETWQDGQIPDQDARVLIPVDLTVQYDRVSDTELFSLRVDGQLDFATDVDTQLRLDTLVVSPLGKLTIGTAENPIQAGVEARIAIADNGLINTLWDPKQLSRGILALGAVEIHGQPKTAYLNLALDPAAGDSTLILESVLVDWEIGDMIVLPGADQRSANPDSPDEVFTIQSMAGNRITLDRPVQFDHETVQADTAPFVVNYTRNVVIETDNADKLPSHQRGHVMFLAADEVDIRYAKFHELGRTDQSKPLDNALLSESDRTNIDGRYPLYLKQTGSQAASTPAILSGNSIVGSPGYGVVQENSHTLLENNAAYDVLGISFVAATEQETGTWLNNVADSIESREIDALSLANGEDIASEGNGFRIPGNSIESDGNLTPGAKVWESETSSRDAQILSANLSKSTIENSGSTETLSVAALSVPMAASSTASAQPTGNVFYIAPQASGRQDGSSWSNAADLSDLSDLLEAADPGDEIWIRGDQGAYQLDGTITLQHGGAAGKPIVVRGVNGDGSSSAQPLLVGNRASDWEPGLSDGQEVFRLVEGADHLKFSNLSFKNVGNGAFRIAGDIEDLTIQNMKADNVRRFIENTAGSGASSATVSGLVVQNVEVRGFSKGAIRLRYDSHDVLIEDVFGDSERQDGDNFAMGIMLDGTVHDVVHRRVTMLNSTQTKGSSEYWNGDGFVAEGGTYNITYEETYAAGSTDGGYDLKSSNTQLINTYAGDNKRNYRFWGDAVLQNIISEEPVKRGGTGAASHLWAGGDAQVQVSQASFIGDDNISNIVFELDGTSQVSVDGYAITDNRYQLENTENGTELTLKNRSTQPFFDPSQPIEPPMPSGEDNTGPTVPSEPTVPTPQIGKNLGARNAEMWEFEEWDLTNASYSGNPFDLDATVTFTHTGTGETRTTSLFYDGNNEWSFRFTGDLAGTWTYETDSRDGDLDGFTGTVNVRPNDDPNIDGFLTSVGNKFAIQKTDANDRYRSCKH
jgi:hypothetical protein